MDNQCIVTQGLLFFPPNNNTQQHTIKQWLCTVKGIQRYKRFQTYFSGTLSKAMSKNLKNAIYVRSREKFKEYQVNFIAPLFKPR